MLFCLWCAFLFAFSNFYLHILFFICVFFFSFAFSIFLFAFSFFSFAFSFFYLRFLFCLCLSLLGHRTIHFIENIALTFFCTKLDLGVLNSSAKSMNWELSFVIRAQFRGGSTTEFAILVNRIFPTLLVRYWRLDHGNNTSVAKCRGSWVVGRGRGCGS